MKESNHSKKYSSNCSSERSRRRQHSHDQRNGKSHHNARNQQDPKNNSKNNSEFRQSNILNDVFRSFARGAATTAGSKFTSSLGSYWKGTEDNVSYGKPGDFDIFLFAQSWSPRFCCSNSKQCIRENMKGVNDTSVHGVWPAYTNEHEKTGRTFPSFCSKANIDQETLKEYPFINHSQRAKHEWTKHGTCTILTSKQYFDSEEDLNNREEILDLREELQDAVSNSIAGEIPIIKLNSIYEAIGSTKKVAIMTNNFCQLQEITTCWEKKEDGSIGKMIDCPAHLLGSQRNSAILNNCNKVALDNSKFSECAFISKEFLKKLKDSNY